jgi:hypothetical protein
MSLFRCREASGAVVSDYGQFSLSSKILEETLSAVDEGADYAQISFFDSVVRFHCTQVSIVECTHHERFSQIIKMLSHCNYIKAFTTSTIVYHSSLHAGTKSTYRVFLHAGLCSLNNCVSFKEVGDLNFIS